MADVQVFSSMLVVVTTISVLVKGQTTTCTPLSSMSNICTDMAYNSTCFPNILGNPSEETADLEIHQYFPLVYFECSDVIKDFLCSVYFPMCNPDGDVIQPCRQTCQSARLGCETLMNKFGFTWPGQLQCDRFPDREHETCMYFESNMTEPSTTTTTTTQATTTAGAVWQKPSDFTRYCDILPYPNPTFPNFLGHLSFEDALRNFEKFDRMLWSKCSQKLSQFMCLLHFPTNDKATSKPVLPCWEFCLKVRTECLLMLPVSWSKSFSCERLPSKITPGSKCYGEDFKIYSTPSTSDIWTMVRRAFGTI